MARRFVTLVLALSLGVASLAAAPVRGAEVAVSATVLGTRAITTATLPPLVPGVASVLTAAVTETTATGVNGWSVTAKLCKPNATNALVADCASNTMVHSTDATKTIPGSAVAISNRAVVVVDGGGTSTAVTGSEALTATRTIFSNSGQDTGATYTGTYTGTANVTLTVPDGTTPGTYNAFVVVDLVQ